MAESKMSLNLLINSETNRVLFAEANKDCVDFLFHTLSLPLATVIKLLNQQGMVGCISNIYQSIENLNETYIQPDQKKTDFLNRMGTSNTDTSVPLLLPNKSNNKSKALFTCCNSHQYYSDDKLAVCPGYNCQRKMESAMSYVDPPKVEGGFVRGAVTYMVMDDLVVEPISNISSLILLDKYSVKDVSVLKRKTVELGLNEALKLLKASLNSKEVLTQVFLS